MNERVVDTCKRSLTTRILLSACVAAAIVAVLCSFHPGLWRDVLSYCKDFFAPSRLEAFIESYGPFAGAVFVALQALQVVVAPIPGEVTSFAGGFLFGNVLGTILSIIGLTLGSVLAFLIARVFGLRLVERIVKREHRERFDHWATHKGLYVAFILYLIPGFPKDALGYLLGLTHLGLMPFILMNVFGRLPGVVLLTMQGTAMDNHDYRTTIVLVVGSIMITLCLYLTRDRCTTFLATLLKRVLGRVRSSDVSQERDGAGNG